MHTMESINAINMLPAKCMLSSPYAYLLPGHLVWILFECGPLAVPDSNSTGTPCMA